MATNVVSEVDLLLGGFLLPRFFSEFLAEIKDRLPKKFRPVGRSFVIEIQHLTEPALRSECNGKIFILFAVNSDGAHMFVQTDTPDLVIWQEECNDFDCLDVSIADLILAMS